MDPYFLYTLALLSPPLPMTLVLDLVHIYAHTHKDAPNQIDQLLMHLSTYTECESCRWWVLSGLRLCVRVCIWTFLCGTTDTVVIETECESMKNRNKSNAIYLSCASGSSSSTFKTIHSSGALKNYAKVWAYARKLFSQLELRQINIKPCE